MSTLRAVVDSTITLDLKPYEDHRHARLLEHLTKALSFANPEIEKRQRLRLTTRWTEDKICMVEMHRGKWRIPRGAIGVLRKVADESGVALELDDWRVKFVPHTFTLWGQIQLRDYQEAGIAALQKNLQGVLVLPTGAGKTVTAVAAMARIGQPTIVVVHTKDLLDQWAQTVRDLLREEPALFTGKQRTHRPITIAMAQTLARLSDDALEDLLRKFGMLVVDECHHANAATHARIIASCPAKYRLGLTATPDRDDGLSEMLPLVMGPELLRVTYGELIARKILVAPEVRLRNTTIQWASSLAPNRDDRKQGDESREYQAIVGYVAENEQRNALIVGDILAEAREGHVCLVLSGTKEHCELLAARVSAAGVRAEVLTSEVPKKRRQAVLDEARQGLVPVIVATSLADEGLDVPALSRLFLAFPSKSDARNMQRLGRIMRSKAGKTGAVLYDYCDRKVPSLYRQSLKRRRLYCELLGISASSLRAQSGVRA